MWKSGDKDPNRIRKMDYAMRHRGPDANAFFEDEYVSLLHRRLAIIDLSVDANQPFFDISGRYVLIFNGEIYNYREVKSTLPDYPFRTSSDTEVIVAAFAKWGPSCISRIKGMFVFAIWDRHEHALYLFRDRMGVKPLYYYDDGNAFLFASEIRSMLASGLVKPKLNKAAVADYLKYQSVSSPDSIICGVKELPAASFMVIRDGQIQTQCYWNLLEQTPISENDPELIRKKVFNLLQESVASRLISDVPIGAFLSGGIDSSAVVALMSRASASRPVTFNIAFSEKAFDESEYADIVAKKFNTDHHTILLPPTTMLDEFSNALDAMDTPSGDGINTYVVSKAVKKAGLTVALSGVGGDELFAGYPFFKRYHRLARHSAVWNSTHALRKLVANFVSNNKWHDLLLTNTSDVEDVYPVLRQIFSPKEIGALTSLDRNRDAVIELLRDKSQEIRSFPSSSRISVAEYYGYTQQTLLKDTDQMSMAVSLEVREPFFDDKLVRYVLSIPDEIKYAGYPKQLLVESLGDLLPPEIVHRSKKGFTLPWKLWFKNELKEFCETHIKRICQRDFINSDELMKKWNQFLTGDKEVKWVEIMVFVVLEYWMEKNGIA